MAYDIPTLLQGFIKFDQGISEKRDGQNWCEGGRIIKMYYYANKELYIIIIIIINNGGKVICLPNFVWGT